MKHIDTILQKKYNKELRKTPIYKQRIMEIQKVCKEYGIDCTIKDEYAFYQLEIIYESILNKQMFEETFLATYVSMHDYWNDLDYKERSHHMSVDIDRMRQELHSFPFEEDDIYMPMFDPRMNRMYVHDTALLELKQYGRFIKDFKDSIQKQRYGILPYQYGFTSCQFILGDASYFSLYNKDMNRLYFIHNDTLEHMLSFDPECKDVDMQDIMNIAHLYMNEQEEQVVLALLESTLIHEKVKKKLEKYRKKIEKKK